VVVVVLSKCSGLGCFVCYCSTKPYSIFHTAPTPSTPHNTPPPSARAPQTTEAEYALVLEAIARGGTYEQFADILMRMRSDLNQLRSSTLEVIQRFFRSPAAAAAFGEGGAMEGRGAGWGAAKWVAVEESGFSEDAGECGGDGGWMVIGWGGEQWGIVVVVGHDVQRLTHSNQTKHNQIR